ncbi:MAG: coproporphyrinogen dehydrogenase HemZ, partial [Lachnospiraceae bacterium]|nr:coproporphyrinogen dehydrogenase HemZ [Lachnospiraceae bacterium]
MIEINVSEEKYRYDADSLVKEFFPGEEVVNHLKPCEEKNKLKTEIIHNNKKVDVIQTGGLDSLSKKDFRNQLKRDIYDALKAYTGQELPWGTLTGVRPSKIPVSLMRDGYSAEDCIKYMNNIYYVNREKAALAVGIAEREIKIIDDIDNGGVNIYIGIPFCPSKCLYCSFLSYPAENFKNLVLPYLEAVNRELTYIKSKLKNRRINTVYVGGGTPTALDENELEQLLLIVENHINTAEIKEYTVEAGRPDSINARKLELLKKYHVSRISVNPQTMNNRTLEIIGRKHTAQQTKDAYLLARSLGFDNINMDLILGLPGENDTDVMHTMEEIKKLAPDDLTVHSLAIKRGSPLMERISEIERDRIVNTEATVKITSDAAREMGLLPYYMYRQKNIAGNFEN